MDIDSLLQQLRTAPERVEFAQVQDCIAAHYHYTPTRFRNGLGDDPVDNPAGSNEGSCRLFAFAQLHDLNEARTLACFGRYYREDVLGDLGGSGHANIRRFLRDGWDGIRFDGTALTLTRG